MAGACSSNISVKKGMCLSDSLPRIFMENGYCLSRAHLSGCFWVASSSKRRWMRLELWGPETRCWMKLWHCTFLLFPVGGLLKLVSFRSKEQMVWDVTGVTWVDWAANALSVKASKLLCTKMKARPSKRLQGIMLCHVMSFHIPEKHHFPIFACIAFEMSMLMKPWSSAVECGSSVFCAWQGLQQQQLWSLAVRLLWDQLLQVPLSFVQLEQCPIRWMWFLCMVSWIWIRPP